LGLGPPPTGQAQPGQGQGQGQGQLGQGQGPENGQVKVDVSYFGEAHRKSETDAFFGRLSMLLKRIPQLHGDITDLGDLFRLVDYHLKKQEEEFQEEENSESGTENEKEFDKDD
jgi:hypothetical protein